MIIYHLWELVDAGLTDRRCLLDWFESLIGARWTVSTVSPSVLFQFKK